MLTNDMKRIIQQQRLWVRGSGSIRTGSVKRRRLGAIVIMAFLLWECVWGGLYFFNLSLTDSIRRDVPLTYQSAPRGECSSVPASSSEAARRHCSSYDDAHALSGGAVEPYATEFWAYDTARTWTLIEIIAGIVVPVLGAAIWGTVVLIRWHGRMSARALRSEW